MEQPPTTIAVLNDDQLYRHLLGQLLAEEGYRVIESTTGADAYPIVRAARPGLVILDVRVGSPDDGWLTLELLRLDPATARTPIIVCSANTFLFRGTAARLRALGCTLIEKPLLLEELLDVVRRALVAGGESGLRADALG